MADETVTGVVLRLIDVLEASGEDYAFGGAIALGCCKFRPRRSTVTSFAAPWSTWWTKRILVSIDGMQSVHATQRQHRERGLAAVLGWKRLLVALVMGACCACADEVRSGDATDAGDIDAGSEPDEDAAEAEDAEAPGPRPLVHAALWQRVPRNEDPFAGDAALPCAPDGYGEENLGGELAFFVRTELCAAITVQQPSRAALRAGETVQIHAYHFPLTAPEQSTARLLVQIGDSRVWERELPIPSPAAEIVEAWEADADYPAGTPVLFHVSNHGNNEYDLIGVEVVP